MSYGMPYMGGKSDIIPSLALNFPKADNFYDLFGGGFSVTHYLVTHKRHRYKNFYYNEPAIGVVDLVKDAVAGKYSYDVFKPPWVSREDFFKHKENNAYIRLIWSFGNDQDSYLFGQDIEEYKRSLHMAVVFDMFNETAKKALGINEWPAKYKTIYQRRLYVRNKVRIKKGKPEQLQQLERLEQLERLQQLERLNKTKNVNINFSALSYEQVKIEPNSIIYCDIPYAGTKQYTIPFDHKKFFDWAANHDCPVFISEHAIKDNRFKLIYEIDRKTRMSSKGQIDGKPERLYWNGK